MASFIAECAGSNTKPENPLKPDVCVCAELVWPRLNGQANDNGFAKTTTTTIELQLIRHLVQHTFSQYSPTILKLAF